MSVWAVLLGASASSAEDAASISWKRTQLDKTFRSEGVAIADLNKDGKMDIIAGDVWYEAPDWKMHEIRPPKDYGDGAKGYSQSFCCFADDFNGDGWTDVLVIGFPGAPCTWYENPHNEPGHWKAHTVWHSACNETPLFADLFGTGKPVLIMGWQAKNKEHSGQMAWFRPGTDPTQTWEMHPISEPGAPGKPTPGTNQFSHGLGVGDLNGDGRLDVLCTDGWWEQPAKDEGTPWSFHRTKMSQPCANMYAYDVDGDGLADVISSSAHQYGIWWHQQRKSSAGDPTFLEQSLFPKLVSQTHALHCVDVNGDGLKDLITGKRWWAHGPKGDADPNAPPKLFWFEAKKGSDGITQFVPHEIDDDSGIGTQFAVGDINGDGLLDVAVSNKKGTFIFLQARGKK
jgi:hypothetical protein